VNRSGGASGLVSVSYTTTDATAKANTDYTAKSGTLSWAANDVSAKSISIPISNATPFLGQRTFSLALSGATGGAKLGTPSAVASINGSSSGSASSIAVSTHIVVDQFGYRPNDPKVAVLRSPQVGFDIADTYTPGSSYQVRRAADGVSVMSGSITAWNGGATQASSGDKGWWFDFSSVTTPGTYFVYDVTNNVRSPTFSIDQQVYKNIVKAATRMYFYQRSGFAKTTPYVDACFADGAAYVGANQDTQARDITDTGNASKVRDLSGGWFDAGDTNKYVTFAMQPVHQLLTAYQEHPAVFTDDFNIPESGNGVADVVDEVKWEIDWIKKMQFADGSVAQKVGTTILTSASPPSTDASARYYVPACTSSTITAAGMMAHASYVYQSIPALATEAADLKTRATNAWNNYQSIPTKQTNCDTGIVHAGDADLTVDDQNAQAVVAAVYLYAITGDAAYNSYVKAHYQETRPYHDIGWSRYTPEQGEALLWYTKLPNADASLKTSILADKQNDVNGGSQVYRFAANDDLYRAFLHDPQYHWGSNNPRGNYGNSNVDVLTYGLAGSSAASYSTRALEILHYFHGVNPFGMVYLTNMYAFGATKSANEIFHMWYHEGTKWSDAKTSQCGPAPGYVPGGPNASAAASGVPTSLVPPTGQPPQKSYKDWNGDGAQASWVITEPGIYFQSSYLKLLSAFAQ
jgi:hypothetical protein